MLGRGQRIDPKTDKLMFRVYDYTNDMTLSANWADTPYNRKSFGVPNINVD